MDRFHWEFSLQCGAGAALVIGGAAWCAVSHVARQMLADTPAPPAEERPLPSLSEAIAWDLIRENTNPYVRWTLLEQGIQFLAVAADDEEDTLRSKLWRQYVGSFDRQDVGSFDRQDVCSFDRQMNDLLEEFRQAVGYQEDAWFRRRIRTFFHATNLFAARSIWNRGFDQREIIEVEDLPLLKEMAEVSRGENPWCIGPTRMVEETGGKHTIWGAQYVKAILDYANGPEWLRLFSGQEDLRSKNREAGRRVVEGRVTDWGLENRREEMLAFFDKYWTRFATRDEGVGLMIFGVQPESLGLEEYTFDVLRLVANDRSLGEYQAEVANIAWKRVFFVEDELLGVHDRAFRLRLLDKEFGEQ